MYPIDYLALSSSTLTKIIIDIFVEIHYKFQYISFSIWLKEKNKVPEVLNEQE